MPCWQRCLQGQGWLANKPAAEFRCPSRCPLQLEAALGQQQELSFSDLLTVLRPAGQRLIEDKEGHKLVRRPEQTLPPCTP